jgi:hypothetical protein
MVAQRTAEQPMVMGPRDGGWWWAAAAGSVAVVAWLAYAPILGAWFRHDDFWWLATAQRWDAGTLPVAYAPAGVAPLYNLLYHLSYQAWGLHPQPYFAVLLLCHALAAVLVVVLLRLLTGQLPAAWAGGMLFAVLYCHHEAVAWPAGGPHVFTAFGILLALICWVLYRRGRRWALAAAIAFALMATFTKDSGIAVVPLLLALDLLAFPGRRRWALAGLALPLLALGAWRALMPPIEEPMTPGSSFFHLGPHILGNLVFAVPQLVLPDLRFENYLALLQRALPQVAVGAVVAADGAGIVLLSLLALVGLWRGNALVRLGIAWCYLGFLPFAPFSYEYARAPRYLYIPSIGLALLAAVAAEALRRRLASRLSGRALLAVALAVGYLAASFGFARVVCANRLRDSDLRREVLAAVHERVPAPEFDAAFVLRGLPEPLQDITLALPVVYGRPVEVVIDGATGVTPRYEVEFDPAAPATVTAFRRVPAASEHRLR